MDKDEEEKVLSMPCWYRDPKGILRCTECGQSHDLCVCLNVSEDAHKRLWSPEGRVIRGILQELIEARDKYPEDVHTLAALMREVGTLSDVMIGFDRNREGVTQQDVMKEAIQVAVMAIRVAIEGDNSFAYDSAPLFRES